MTSRLEPEPPDRTGPPNGAETGAPATYGAFDTEDLRLAARGITLCHRAGEWRLTLPPAAEERLPGPYDAVPARFAALVAVHTRGRPLVQVPAPQTRPATPPGPQEYRTAGDVVTSYVAEQLATILAYDPKVRQAEYDSVHKMRVAVRRIRSILRTAGRLLEPEPAGRLEAELKWLAGELGEVRDLEVLRERFAGRLAEIGASAPSWLAGLRAKERLAYVRLNHTLAGERYFALLDALDAFVADPPFTERASGKARKAVPALVARAWRRVARRHAELEHAEDPDEARHRTRKAAKRARYTAEAARPVLGEAAHRLAVQASKVQETLGAYQDSVIARERLAELDTGEADARTIDALIDVERDAADQALHDAREVWAEAADPKYVEALSA